jgi:hypothetical protein
MLMSLFVVSVGFLEFGVQYEQIQPGISLPEVTKIMGREPDEVICSLGKCYETWRFGGMEVSVAFAHSYGSNLDIPVVTKSLPTVRRFVWADKWFIAPFLGMKNHVRSSRD